MLKRMTLKKITVTCLTLLVLLVIYLIPSRGENKIDLNDKQNLEYTYSNDFEVIYLLDSDNYVARTKIKGCGCEKNIDKANDLINSLIMEGKKSNYIPNGFRSIIPPNTKVLSLNLENEILTIDFSNDLLSINKSYEEKMIEALVYTLTSIDDIKKVIIKVEGKILEKLPISGKTIPSVLDKSYGINKVYEINSLNSIDSYTVFYINEFNDNYYYVPVTKYINNTNQDKIKVIIEELTSAPIYESNLMSFLNVNTKLLDYEIKDNQIKLNFNSMILNDITKNNILEEVIYTIGLSINNSFDIKEISFYVENQEIHKTTIKNIE